MENSLNSKEVIICDDVVKVKYLYEVVVECPLIDNATDISLGVCSQCGKPMFEDELPRRDKQYCSTACKAKAYRERKKLINKRHEDGEELKK